MTNAELQQALEEAIKANEELQKQLAAKPAAHAVDPKRPWPASKILTVSEHAELTPEQQQAFRAAHGTVTSDPAE